MEKSFTIEEANRALVFVAPILKEIQILWGDLMTLKANPASFYENVLREKLNRLKTCGNELNQVGCLVRDPVEGIVDFLTFYKNQPVFLCWQLGEEQAEYWHGEEGVYVDRQAIDEDFADWNSKLPDEDLKIAEA